MEQIDRRTFMTKASRWALGLGALGLTGALASCSSGSDAGDTTSDTTSNTSGNTSGSVAASDEPTASTAKAVVTDECVGCGKCTRACEVGAISISGRRAVISEACRGCGDCVRFCPAGAIVLAQSGSTVSLALADSQAA